MNTAPLIATPTTNAAAVIDSLETAGTFFPYNSAAAPAELPSLRVITATYKQTAAMKAKGKEARNNVYVRVPTAHLTLDAITARIEELAPYILSYLQGVEDEGIRKYHKEGGIQVFTDTLSLDKIIATLEESGNTGLSGEVITSWFTDSVAPSLLRILAAKMGTDVENLTLEQESKVAAVTQSYLDSFISLASGKTMMSADQRAKLEKCMVLTSSGDTMLGNKFIARFYKMEEKEREALNSLGDLEL